MASVTSDMEHPCVVWKIKNLPDVRQESTHYRYYNDRRFRLTLKQEANDPVEGDHITMYLLDGGRRAQAPSHDFVMTVCIRDALGHSHFVKITEVNVADLENSLRIWTMRKSDLVARYKDISTDGVVTFVCTPGPSVTPGVKRKRSDMEEHESVQALPSVKERCLNYLQDDPMDVVQDSRVMDVVQDSRETDVPFDKVEGLDDSPAAALYAVANNSAVDGLKEICKYFMMRNLTEDNIFSVAVFAHTHNDGELRKDVASFILENDSLFKKRAWVDFWNSNYHLAMSLLKDCKEEKNRREK